MDPDQALKSRRTHGLARAGRSSARASNAGGTSGQGHGDRRNPTPLKPQFSPTRNVPCDLSHATIGGDDKKTDRA
jgi:hypothetical protein